MPTATPHHMSTSTDDEKPHMPSMSQSTSSQSVSATHAPELTSELSIEGAATVTEQATTDSSSISEAASKANDVMPSAVDAQAVVVRSESTDVAQAVKQVGLAKCQAGMQTTDIGAVIKRITSASGRCAESAYARLEQELATADLSAPQLAVVAGIATDKLLQASKHTGAEVEPAWGVVDVPE